METKRPKPLTLRQFQAKFQTEESCLEHLMRVRYGQRHVCAKCEREARYYRVKARRSYECEHCGHQVYPTAGTPFEKTRTSLRDWFHVMFLFTASRNGVSVKEVQRTIGVTYKTAWRMAKLIREYMGYVNGDDTPGGSDGAAVEIDPTFVGGHDAKGQGDKMIVLGMVESGGSVVTRGVPDLKVTTNIPAMREVVKAGSRITSDAGHTFGALGFIGMDYNHLILNHRAGQRSKGYRSTNTIKGLWNLVKRGINGTYISVSQKHLPTYRTHPVSTATS